MRLEYVPLLSMQRDLYRIPRGMERFREYLRTMVDADTDDIKSPLMSMNPMGKDHLLPFLDGLLAIDADGEGAHAAIRAEAGLADVPGNFKISLVVCDDLHGGWTNRYAAEFSHRFEQEHLYKRGFITGLLWTSRVDATGGAAYAPAEVREEILACVHRAAYVQRHGPAHTLAEMLGQEGYALSKSGAAGPMLGDEDSDFTRAVLARFMPSKDKPILMAAWFGDPAARELGLEPLGLSPEAGSALALRDFRG